MIESMAEFKENAFIKQGKDTKHIFYLIRQRQEVAL